MSSTDDVIEYRRRIVDDELDELLPELPAISLEGAKGVGKTSTALARGGAVVRLDTPGARSALAADFDYFAHTDGLVVVDEWQRFPTSWDMVRRAVDAAPRGGRFLLTGSASPAAPQTHSGAGRIVSVRMRPLTLAERGVGEPTVSLAALLSGDRPRIEGHSSVRLPRYTEEILLGGFPGLRRGSARVRASAIDGYLHRVVDRDYAEAGTVVRNPTALRRWLTAFAAVTATTATFETIRDASTPGIHDKPAKTTVINYRDALERMWLSDPLPAWVPPWNHLRRLTLAPKHHLADPALAAALVGLDADALLSGAAADRRTARDGAFLEALFESLVVLDVRVYAQAAESRVSHLRTKSDAREIDLIVERRDHRVLAIEVKLSQAVDDDDVRHLRWLADQLGPDLLDAVVVTTGTYAYRRKDGIAVVPAALLGP